MSSNEVGPTTENSVVHRIADRYGVMPLTLKKTLMATIMPGNVTEEQFIAVMLVADAYRLNPLTKEIYAFPGKGGGIMPIVSIDGWTRIMNEHPQFDGIEFEHLTEDGALLGVTAVIFRKDRSRATKVTEWMNECKGNTEPWKRWPARMLRHKATIQCARLAFGFAGIYDPDEASRIQSAVTVEETPTAPKMGVSAIADAVLPVIDVEPKPEKKPRKPRKKAVPKKDPEPEVPLVPLEPVAPPTQDAMDYFDEGPDGQEIAEEAPTDEAHPEVLKACYKAGMGASDAAEPPTDYTVLQAHWWSAGANLDPMPELPK